MSTVGHIKLIASSIDVTTEVHSEVETKAQVKLIITVPPPPSPPPPGQFFKKLVEKSTWLFVRY